MSMILSKTISYSNMPRNKSRIYLHLLLLLYFAQVLVLESIWLGLKYTLFYVNVNHLVATKVDVRLALMLTIQTFFRVLLQRRVNKVNHIFDCDSKCIIYFFSCKVCGLQYVGSTVERFHFKRGSTRGHTTTELFSPTFSKWRTSWFNELLWDHFNH